MNQEGGVGDVPVHDLSIPKEGRGIVASTLARRFGTTMEPTAYRGTESGDASDGRSERRNCSLTQPWA